MSAHFKITKFTFHAAGTLAAEWVHIMEYLYVVYDTVGCKSFKAVAEEHMADGEHPETPDFAELATSTSVSVVWTSAPRSAG